MHWGRGRRVVSASARCALILSAVVLAASGAAAADGLQLGSDTSYVVDEAARKVTGRMELRAVNDKPDPPGGYYYYNSLTVLMPSAVANVRASASGKALRVRTVAGKDPLVQEVTLSLPYDLRYRQAVTLVVEFDLPAGAARSASSTRVGPGYASFEVFGLGDPGRTSVTIARPPGATLEASDPGFVEVPNESAVRSSSTNGPGGITAAVAIRQPSEFQSQPVSVGDAVFHIEPWPDDPEWATRVKAGVEQGTPILAGLVGKPWPTTGTTVREDAVVNVMGFDGWYDASARELVLGEQAEPHVIYHELAHAWVNATRFENRWVYEGLAEWLAAHTVTATSGESLGQTTVAPADPGAIRLTTWSPPAKGRSLPEDSFAYPASLAAVSGVLDGLSEAEVGQVLKDALSGEKPFPAASADATSPLGDRAFLDLLERSAPHPSAVEAYRTWVLEPADAAKLEARTHAYAVFRDIEKLDGDWHPHAMSVAMEQWDFEAAMAASARDRGTATVVGELLAASRQSSIALPPVLRQSYETGALEKSELVMARAAVTDLAAARTATQNPLASIVAPLLGVQTKVRTALAALGAEDFTRASGAASAAADRARWATPLGGLAALVLATLLGMTGFAVRQRSPRRRAPGIASR